MCSDYSRSVFPEFVSFIVSLCLSLVVSEEPVVRDQFYDGNIKTERGTCRFLHPVTFVCSPLLNFFSFFSPGAVVLRLARSWFRFGSLEILTRSGELDLLRSVSVSSLWLYFHVFREIKPEVLFVSENC